MSKYNPIPSAFDGPYANYEHVSMYSSVPEDPFELLATVNKSAADPIVSHVDRHIETLCRSYAAANEEQQADLRRNATNGHSLLHFAHRMAIRAMRTGDIDCIRLGLISIIIENARIDPRDNIVGLAMLNHAASRIKCSFATLADEVLKMSSPHMGEYIREFVARDPELQSLEAMGCSEELDENGPWIRF